MSSMFVCRFKIQGNQPESLLDVFEDQAVSCAVVEHEAEGFWVAEILFSDPAPSLTQIQDHIAIHHPTFQGKLWDWEINPLPDVDWLAQNRKDFPPIHVGRYHIFRSHHTSPSLKEGEILITLEAGTAFGSGTHESTQGCLKAFDLLSQNHTFKRILDVGCGSGILAIAAAHTWPNAQVIASDLDPEAVTVTQMNSQHNHVGARILSYHAEDLEHPDLQGPFDLIVANILLEPLLRIAPALQKALAPHGVVVLSGLLTHQKEAIERAYTACGLSVTNSFEAEPWLSLILRP